MSQPNNIIRLGELVGPPAREGGAHRERRTEAESSSAGGSDLTNVIPFTRLRRDNNGDDAAAKLVLGDRDRPAPEPGRRDTRKLISALVLASALIHGGLLAALNREPPPMASIGIEAISVELVLGANSNAGPATTPSEAQSPPSPAPTEPEQPPAPREAALAPADVPPDAAPQPPPEDPSRPQATAPAEVTAEPRTEQAVTSHQEAALPPKEPESRRPEEPRKPVAQPPSSPARKPQRRDSTNRARPAATDPRVDNRRVAALPPAGAPSGVGPGRSDSDTNYRGTAAAHLARYKQFPAEARSRGEQGTSVVSFSIDGSGRVTRVSLVRSTGIASLDRESEAMVRRASPFPPPPGGRPITLSAPVNFHLR